MLEIKLFATPNKQDEDVMTVVWSVWTAKVAPPKIEISRYR